VKAKIPILKDNEVSYVTIEGSMENVAYIMERIETGLSAAIDRALGIPPGLRIVKGGKS
jgi:hypothetical protein